MSRAFAALLQSDLGGRQTALVVAGAIFQIAVDVVFQFGETDLLDEGCFILEVLQLHIEHLVHLLDDVALRGQFADELCALHLHHVEGGFDRAVLTNIRGIDMPAWVDGGVEDDLRLSAFAGLQL